nr:probable ATP-dependent RNA helicase DDX43 [Leptinotarsa decemlineata]
MCENWDDDAPVVATVIPSFRRPGNNDEVWSGSTSNNDRPYYQRSKQYSRGRGNFRGNSREGRSDRRNGRAGDKCEELRVKCSFVGKIIGRAGAKIQELQSESGASIQVTQESNGETTLVKIFGNDSTISKAKELIEELTTDSIKIVHAKDLPQETVEKKQPILDWAKFMQECDEAEAAEWAKYPPIRKQFYKEHPEVMKMSESQVEKFREENNNIVVDRTFKTENSAPIPKPCPKFVHAFHEYPEILREIEKAGFETPSPIQAQAWPVLLSGEDLIGIAQTGTGKTLAFLLPAMIHLEGQNVSREDRGGPAVLIMAPTRELALQIDKEIKKYQYRGINSVCVYGGGNRKEQVAAVTRGVDIIIATPGRLNDFHESGIVNVKTVTYVVLDEADRMLDMGFEPQIRKVMYCIRPTRQTVMTSATWPLGVRRLAQSYMKDPIQVYVGSLDLAATHTVTQVIQVMEDNEDVKMDAVMEFVRNLGPDQKVIIFCGKKARADNLSTEFALSGIQCQAIHGDRDQCDREQALVDIANGTVQILVATDVASRGLDIDDITHVLNFDFPRNIEEYVHRVGRTGRAGKLGESISYFTRADWAQARELIKILEEADQFVPEEIYQMADRFDEMKKRKENDRARGGGSRGGRGGSSFGGMGRRW